MYNAYNSGSNNAQVYTKNIANHGVLKWLVSGYNLIPKSLLLSMQYAMIWVPGHTVDSLFVTKAQLMSLSFIMSCFLLFKHSK